MNFKIGEIVKIIHCPLIPQMVGHFWQIEKIENEYAFFTVLDKNYKLLELKILKTYLWKPSD